MGRLPDSFVKVIPRALNFTMQALKVFLLLVGCVASLPHRFQRHYPRYGYNQYNGHIGYAGYNRYNVYSGHSGYIGYRKPFTAFNKDQKLSTGNQNTVFFRLGEVNADKYADQLLSSPLTSDSRVTAANDLTSPTAAAALAYLKSVSTQDLCGLPAETYLETIFSGKSKEEANAAAAKIYINAYNDGETNPSEGACGAAEAAYRAAFRKGEDPILGATLAFVNNWPGAKDGNPCAASGIEYMKAIIAGESHLEAGRVAATGFANAFKELAEKGKPLNDPACLDATRAFFKAVPEKPDPAVSAAFYAYTDKIFEDNAPAFDPVCLSALEGYIESYSSGDDVETANLKAAQSFFKAFTKGSPVPADSACAAATLAYAKESQIDSSSSNAAALIAYVTDAITGGDSQFDPVCAAATEAYFDSYVTNKSESDANDAAAVAYIEALGKNPDFDENSSCGKAAAAYIAQYQ